MASINVCVFKLAYSDDYMESELKGRKTGRQEDQSGDFILVEVSGDKFPGRKDGLENDLGCRSLVMINR